MGKRTAVAQVFALPELVAQIVYQFNRQPRKRRERHRQLLRLALVARVWLEPVLDILWKKTTSLDRLLFISNTHGRRQHYANKIRKLVLQHHSELDNPLMDLSTKLNNLEDLEIGNVQEYLHDYEDYDDLDSLDPSWVTSLLGPKLEELRLFCPRILSEDVLQHLATCCPRLRLTCLVTADTSELVLRIVKALRDLRGLHLCLDPKLSTLPEELPSAISQLTEVEVVWMMNNRCQPLGLPLMSTKTGSTERPFRHLKSFEAHIDFPTLTRLPELMPGLSELELSIPDRAKSDGLVISHLTHLSGLEYLRLNLREEEPLPLDATELAALCSFRRLKEITIRASDPSANSLNNDVAIPARDLTDALFAEICQGLPLLESLSLGFCSHRLTARSLLVLGTSCRGLEYLCLPGQFDLRQVGPSNIQPIFPKLHTIETGRFCMCEVYREPKQRVSRQDVEDMAFMIGQQVPLLTEVKFSDDVKLEKKFRKILK